MTVVFDPDLTPSLFLISLGHNFAAVFDFFFPFLGVNLLMLFAGFCFPDFDFFFFWWGVVLLGTISNSDL